VKYPLVFDSSSHLNKEIAKEQPLSSEFGKKKGMGWPEGEWVGG
jgi:hypothetical protein